MIKRIRIPVDHGNGNIKTMNTVFKTGISASDLAPGRGMEYLEYNGKFYLPSNRRIPYQRDKTKDFRFFALTLMVIAKELELNKNGIRVPQNVKTKDELKQYLCQLNLKMLLLILL